MAGCSAWSVAGMLGPVLVNGAHEQQLRAGVPQAAARQTARHADCLRRAAF
jgi:hypothetical protein